MAVCETCAGTGRCTTCGGGGKVERALVDCPNCHGSGDCPMCGGRGERDGGLHVLVERPADV